MGVTARSEMEKLGQFAELIRAVSFAKEKVSALPQTGYLPLLRRNNIQGVAAEFLNRGFEDERDNAQFEDERSRCRCGRSGSHFLADRG
jgi:hypothetical protein